MRGQKRKLIILVLITSIISMFVLVHPVFAATSSSVASSFTGGLTDVIAGAQNILSGSWIANLLLTILTFLMELLGKLINILASAIADVLKWPAVFGNTAVITVWKQIRDICNMFFIVILIGISFATIFNVFPRFKNWDARKALSGLIIAAITINFSLPVGQAITGFGNFLTGTMVGMFPNVGEQLVETLKPAMTLAAGFSSDAGVAADADNLTSVESQRYEACLKEGAPTTWDTVRNASSRFVSWFTGVTVTINSRLKTSAECYSEITAARQQSLGPTASQGTSSPGTMLFISALFNVITLGIIASCLATVLIFLLVRIIAIWILLALSPLPFFALAIPGGGSLDDNFKLGGWFKRIVAWNMFGPLYLFVLGMGLIFLSGQGEFMTDIISQGGVPAFSIFQILLFYFFAAFIFIGGLGAVVKGTLAASIKSTALVGGLTGRLGVFDSFGSAPARFLGRRTGITTELSGRYEGIKGGIQSQYEKRFVKPDIRREEELSAKYKARFGDKGAWEALQKKRIDEQMKKNKDSGIPVADLWSDFNKGPQAGEKYFAAGKALLDEGELSDEQMAKLATDAANISPQYGQAIREASQRKIKEKIKEKKYKKVDDVLQVMESMNLNDPKNERERKNFLNNLKSNQPLLYAKMASSTTGLLVNDKGEPLTTTQALEDVASKMSDEEWVSAFEEGLPLGENASYIFHQKMTGNNEAKKMLRTAKKETRAKLHEEILKLKKEKVRNEVNEKEELDQMKQQALEKRELKKTSKRTQLAAEKAVSMASGISEERAKEIREEMKGAGLSN